MSKRITSVELAERASERNKRKQNWKYCQKCKVNKWSRQFCKCPACAKLNANESRYFIHIGENNPETVDWNKYDQETDSYPSGVSDAWQLCDDCSRKYQVYANWN